MAHAVLMFVFFVAAMVLVLVHAGAKSARSASPWNSVAEYWGANWPDYMLRWTVAAVLYGGLFQHPGVLAVAAKALHAPDFLVSALPGDSPIVVVWYMAIGAGLAGERAADLIIHALQFAYRKASDRLG